MPSLTDSPFAILTNASTVLALGTSNRLARAADRARLLPGQLLSAILIHETTLAIRTLRDERDAVDAWRKQS